MKLLVNVSYRHEAEIIKQLLSNDSIEVFIESDDCGGVDPALQFANGVNVYVHDHDFDLAKKIIKDVYTSDN